MTGWELFFLTVGITYCVSRLFVVIDIIEGKPRGSAR